MKIPSNYEDGKPQQWRHLCGADEPDMPLLQIIALACVVVMVALGVLL